MIPRRLPFTASNTAIRTFRHALSLDERRAKFQVNHYQRTSEADCLQGTHPGDMPRPHMRRTRTEKHPNSKAKPSLTAKDGGAVATGLSVENEAAERAETAGNSAETAVEAAEGIADEVADARGQAGNKLWTDTWHWFGTLMRKKDKSLEKSLEKSLTEEEAAFSKLQQQLSTKPKPTDVKEVWFAGCHRGLSHLLWILVMRA